MSTVVAISRARTVTTSPKASVHQPSSLRTRRLGPMAMVCIVAAIAFLAGYATSIDRAWQDGHTRGACIALEFAENFGAVTTPQKQQAMRAMAVSASPHRDLFPKSIAAFETACASAWASAVSFGR